MGLENGIPDSVYSDTSNYRSFFFILVVVGCLIGIIIGLCSILRLFFSDIIKINVFLVCGEILACIICGIVVWYAMIRLRQVERFVSYKLFIGDQSCVLITDLAKMCGHTESFVLHDIRIMLRRKWFVQGQLNENTRELFLTKEAWKARQSGRSVNQIIKITRKDLSRYDEFSRYFLERCYSVLEILSKDISLPLSFIIRQKLQLLYSLIVDIAHGIEESPGHARELEKFADKYIPTLTKVLDNIHCRLQISECNKLSAVEEREVISSLETLSGAFSDVLDVLFEDSDWNIDSEIAVYNTGLNQL